jgi:hypothetical protein
MVKRNRKRRAAKGRAIPELIPNITKLKRRIETGNEMSRYAISRTLWPRVFKSVFILEAFYVSSKNRRVLAGVFSNKDLSSTISIS